MKQRKLGSVLLAIGVPFMLALVVFAAVEAMEPGGHFIQTTEPYQPRPALRTYVSANGELEFRYPPKLTVTEQGRKIFIRHAVHFEHPDPCDAKNRKRKLGKLEDFRMEIQVGPFPNFREAQEWVTLGGRMAVRVREGSGACAANTYYLPIGERRDQYDMGLAL